MTIHRRAFLVAAALTAAHAPGPAKIEDAPHRFIDPRRCLGCGRCVPLCPMGAISLDGRSSINPDECAECGVCVRSRVCPADAIRTARLAWPRVIREIFSNPLTEHESTGVPGRGTEEIKTNDSHERYPRGVLGVYIELGRPALGARFRDADIATRAFAERGFQVAEDNPLRALIPDPATGAIRDDVLNEKAISILIEFVVPRERAPEVLELAQRLGQTVDTVFNLSIALRANPDGSSPLVAIFGDQIFSLPNGKVNLGLAAGIGKNTER
jgi:ferredoxin